MNDYILNFGEINQKFVEWFCSNGGKISPKIAFKDYSSENSGRGVVAVDDIQPFEVLFSIPHSIILSEKTSSLKDLIPSDEFEKLGKINSWFPLILCMMYESQKEDSLWKPYFDILPREFDTPMFWNEEQLAELEGTSVIDKIGRVEAEIQFNEHLLPIIQSIPSIFDSNKHNLELFHCMGSLVMANAFQNKIKKDDAENNDEVDEDEEITMMPMADMLNHKTGFNNYNTYGELCSADLLRKYGFVDENNIHDIVELNGQFVVDTLSIDEDTKDKKAFKLNIEMLLEEDILNDILILDTTKEIPPELIIIAKIMTMDKAQFKKFRKTNNFPEPKMNLDIKTRLIQLFEKRLSMYKTSIKDDDEILKSNNISLKLKYTIIMRLSEKRILHGLLDNLNNWNDDENKEEIQRKKRKIK
ncbi:828_t:CDS:10 [Funneliformis mosseae]|uniref:828_t:CDS:1 n=1 Tax=Funneliformis mosseae TaxID=27381 RepID=A0A9N8Z8A4_FUNMO|nr:828_t:CDS:10 [Funneliformis mosseae]